MPLPHPWGEGQIRRLRNPHDADLLPDLWRQGSVRDGGAGLHDALLEERIGDRLHAFVLRPVEEVDDDDETEPNPFLGEKEALSAHFCRPHDGGRMRGCPLPSKQLLII